MKIRKLILIAICFAMMETSCNSNENKSSLVYSGSVTFNSDSTKIETLSKGGYISYTKNGDRLIIESDNKGGVTYTINNGVKVTELKDDQKLLLQEAVIATKKNLATSTISGAVK